MGTMVEVQKILAERRAEQERYSVWRRALLASRVCHVAAVDELPSLFVPSAGARVDIVTMRLPSAFRERHEEFFLRLLNLTIEHVRELYGDEVVFSRAAGTQLVVVRFLRADGFSCYGLSLTRDGNMVRIEVRHGAYAAKPEDVKAVCGLIAASRTKPPLWVFLVGLQVALVAVVAMAAIALGLLIIRTVGVEGVTAGGVVMYALCYALVLPRFRSMEGVEGNIFAGCFLGCFFFLGGILMTRGLLLFPFEAVFNAAVGLFGQPTGGWVCIAALCSLLCWRLIQISARVWQRLVVRRAQALAGSVAEAAFRVDSCIEGERETFFSRFPDERNFFSRMNEWIQQVQGLADARGGVSEGG
jgi:hypothetical protein